MKLILKIILLVIVSVVVGLAIYLGYTYITSNNSQVAISTQNSVDETLDIVEDNFNTKSMTGMFKTGDIELKVVVDNKENVQISGTYEGQEFEAFVIDGITYYCISGFCMQNENEITEQLTGYLDQLTNVKTVISAVKPFYETNINGEHIAKTDNYGSITLSNDGSNIKYVSADESIELNMNFSDDEIEPPATLF